MIKRRSAERLDWQRVTERRFTHTQMADPSFTGVVTLLCIDAVSEPLWIKTESQDFCIADAGYSWLQYFPSCENHAVTTMFDAHGQVIQWYIDIVKRHGLDAQGIPWWDDLYLDIIVTPDRKTAIIDQEELDEALQVGAITAAEHTLAWDVATGLRSSIEQGQFVLLDLAAEHRHLLLSHSL